MAEAAGKTVTLTLATSFSSREYDTHIQIGDDPPSTVHTDLTIHGNNAVLDAAGKGFFFWVKGRTCRLAISRVTFKNGANQYAVGGGAISVGGSLTAISCTFINNTAPGYGGAIYIYKGSITLNRCTFSDNTALYQGGALDCCAFDSHQAIDVLIKDCSFIGPISSTKNDIARNNSDTASVTFACPDGETGTPVQMQGHEINVIPPNELHCSTSACGATCKQHHCDKCLPDDNVCRDIQASECLSHADWCWCGGA
jgi:predicted outer membrane repeat protein